MKIQVQYVETEVRDKNAQTESARNNILNKVFFLICRASCYYCQAQVQSPKVQSPKVKTKGTWADTKITRV